MYFLLILNDFCVFFYREMRKQHKKLYFVKIVVETHQFQPNWEPTMQRNTLYKSKKIRILTLRWVPNLGVCRNLRVIQNILFEHLNNFARTFSLKFGVTFPAFSPGLCPFPLVVSLVIISPITLSIQNSKTNIEMKAKPNIANPKANQVKVKSQTNSMVTPKICLLLLSELSIKVICTK